VLVGCLTAVVSVTWSPAASQLVLFSAIIVALLVRPQGLLATGRAR
jgi:branched-chain amino acid transport system permease protein